MNISIIGAGQIGQALALRLVEHGHKVRIANARGPATLAQVASDTGAQPAELAGIARGAEVVVVTIPEKNVPDLPAHLFADVPDGVAVIDTCNYYPQQRDGYIADIEHGMAESQWVARHLGRPVVKAFNTIHAAHLRDKGQPAGTPGRIALPIAGDGAKAKSVVVALADTLGFDGVDAGPLAESWRQQPGAPVYAADLDADGVRAALLRASPVRPGAFRAR